MLDAFPKQPLDFFGAIKSRLADSAVRGWLRETSYEVRYGPPRLLLALPVLLLRSLRLWHMPRILRQL